jgi:hypothetical protein
LDIKSLREEATTLSHKTKSQSTGSYSSGSANHNKHTDAQGHGGGKKPNFTQSPGRKGPTKARQNKGKKKTNSVGEMFFG